MSTPKSTQRNKIVSVGLLFAISAAGAVSVAFFNFSGTSNGGKTPEVFADWVLMKDYPHLEPVSSDELPSRLLSWRPSDHTTALSIKSPYANTADDWSLVPVIKHGDDLFVITWKQSGSTSGLAISSDTEFAAKTEQALPILTTWPIKDGLYGWRMGKPKVSATVLEQEKLNGTKQRNEEEKGVRRRRKRGQEQ